MAAKGCLLISIFYLLTSVLPAIAKPFSLDDAVKANCEAAGIDQCYRDGVTRLVKLMIAPQLVAVINPNQRANFNKIRFNIVADRNAIGAYASAPNGTPTITISTALSYYIHSIAYAAALTTLTERNLSVLEGYVETVVAQLNDNTSRAQRGLATLPTPKFVEFAKITDDELSQLGPESALPGLSAYLFQVMCFFVVSHEVGHHLLDGGIFGNHGPERRAAETGADEFAARSLVKMGYSVYPVIFLMEYLSVVEGANGASDDYPPVLCRMVKIFDAAWAQRLSSPDVILDKANQNMNAQMDSDRVRKIISIIRLSDFCK